MYVLYSTEIGAELAEISMQIYLVAMKFRTTLEMGQDFSV